MSTCPPFIGWSCPWEPLHRANAAPGQVLLGWDINKAGMCLSQARILRREMWLLQPFLSQAEASEALGAGRARMGITSLRATWGWGESCGRPSSTHTAPWAQAKGQPDGVNAQASGILYHTVRVIINTPSIQMKHLLKFTLKGSFVLFAG